MLAMIKAIFMVEKGVILPTAGFEKINPKILDKEKLKLPEAPIPWPKSEKRRILVTNFGVSSSRATVKSRMLTRTSSSSVDQTPQSSSNRLLKTLVRMARSRMEQLTATPTDMAMA